MAPSFFVYMFGGLVGAVVGLYTGRQWEKDSSETKLQLLKAEVEWFRKNSAFKWPGRE